MSKQLTPQHIEYVYKFCENHYVPYYDLQVENWLTIWLRPSKTDENGNLRLILNRHLMKLIANLA